MIKGYDFDGHIAAVTDSNIRGIGIYFYNPAYTIYWCNNGQKVMPSTIDTRRCNTINLNYKNGGRYYGVDENYHGPLKHTYDNKNK